MIWILRSRHNNKKVKHFQDVSDLFKKDKLSSYEELLEKDGSVSVHHRNIHSLAMKMLQKKHAQSREIVTDIFT